VVTLINSAVKSFVCSICFTLLILPVVLSCGHLVCRDCLADLVDTSKPTRTKLTKKCPYCQAVHNLALPFLVQSYFKMRYDLVESIETGSFKTCISIDRANSFCESISAMVNHRNFFYDARQIWVFETMTLNRAGGKGRLRLWPEWFTSKVCAVLCTQILLYPPHQLGDCMHFPMVSENDTPVKQPNPT
jgi:hypothetical protein